MRKVRCKNMIFLYIANQGNLDCIQLRIVGNGTEGSMIFQNFSLKIDDDKIS